MVKLQGLQAFKITTKVAFAPFVVDRHLADLFSPFLNRLNVRFTAVLVPSCLPSSHHTSFLQSPTLPLSYPGILILVFGFALREAGQLSEIIPSVELLGETSFPLRTSRSARLSPLSLQVQV